MKFLITATSIWDYTDMERLLDKFPFLNDFGFSVEEQEYTRKTKIRDENGKPITQVNTYMRKKPYIHIQSLEELMKLTDIVGEYNSIILDNTEENGWEIEIYDDYRE